MNEQDKFSGPLPQLPHFVVTEPANPTRLPRTLGDWLRRLFVCNPFYLASAALLLYGVHLYALGYVYDFPLRREQLAPVLWVLAWTLVMRMTDFVAVPSELLRKAILVLPLLATFVSAFVVGSNVFLMLSVLSFSGFAVVFWRKRGSGLALQLALISLASMISALPVETVHPVVGGFDRMNLIGGAVLGYLAIAVALSRNPKLAMVGVLAVIGSFVLFAFGTAAALTKHRWHKIELNRPSASKE